MWSASRTALSYKPPEEKEHRDAATKQADHDRNSRTNVVLAWVGTNMYVFSFISERASADDCDQPHDPSLHFHGVH